MRRVYRPLQQKREASQRERRGVYFSDMGGVVSEGLAAVVREQEATAVVATPTLELDARRVELFEEMRRSGICTHAAAAYVGRGMRWLYSSSSKRGPRVVQGPRSNPQEKLLPAREALAKACCAKGCAHRWASHRALLNSASHTLRWAAPEHALCLYLCMHTHVHVLCSLDARTIEHFRAEDSKLPKLRRDELRKRFLLDEHTGELHDMCHTKAMQCLSLSKKSWQRLCSECRDEQTAAPIERSHDLRTYRLSHPPVNKVWELAPRAPRLQPRALQAATPCAQAATPCAPGCNPMRPSCATTALISPPPAPGGGRACAAGHGACA